jgi:hypothetical protein
MVPPRIIHAATIINELPCACGSRIDLQIEASIKGVTGGGILVTARFLALHSRQLLIKGTTIDCGRPQAQQPYSVVRDGL